MKGDERINDRTTRKGQCAMYPNDISCLGLAQHSAHSQLMIEEQLVKVRVIAIFLQLEVA